VSHLFYFCVFVGFGNMIKHDMPTIAFGYAYFNTSHKDHSSLGYIYPSVALSVSLKFILKSHESHACGQIISFTI
jgi:hypothetical protein